MQLDVIDFVTAFGLAMVLEGSLYALFPEQTRKMLTQVMMLPPEALRTIGLSVGFVGIFIVWMVRG